MGYEVFEVKSKNRRNKATAVLQNGEWFVHPVPFNPMIVFFHGLRVMLWGKKHLVSWSDAKRHCSDVMDKEVVNAIDGMLAKFKEQSEADPLSGTKDIRKDVPFDGSGKTK